MTLDATAIADIPATTASPALSPGRAVTAAIIATLAGMVMLVTVAWSSGGGILATELQITGASVGRAVGRDIEKALAGQVPLDRLVGMEQFLQQAVENDPLAAYVAIADTRGTVLFASGKGGGPGPAMVFNSAVPIQAGDKVVGEVRVGLDLSLLAQDALPVALALLGCLLAGVALAAALVHALWRAWIAGPFDALSAAMRAAEGGTLIRPGLSGTVGGLRRLAVTLNGLVKDLQDKHATLSELEYAVRAGHFDQGVLARIETLAAPVHRMFGAQDAGRPVVHERGRWTLPRLIGAAVVVVLCISAGVTYYAVDQRRAWFAEALRDETVAGLRTLWRGEQAATSQRLEEAGRDAAASPAVLAALSAHSAAGQRVQLDQLAARLGERFGVGRLEVIGRDGQPLYASLRKSGQSVVTLDSHIILKAMQERRPVHGLQQDETRAYTLAHALPVVQDGVAVGAVTIATDLGQILGRLSAGIETPLLLIDLRGRAAFAADPALRELALGDLPTVQPMVAEKPFAGRLLRLVQIPLWDAAGRPVARLVSVSPVDEQAAALSRLTTGMQVALGALLAAAILVILMVIRRAFQPLHQSMTAVSALSLGELHVDVPGGSRTWEAGMMSAAARRLKEREANLLQLRVSRAKQRRRQQRFIRLQMQGLADTLEPEAREAVLKDLEKLEVLAAEAAAAEAGGGAEPKVGDDLTLLGAAFQNLSHRIRTQYQRLADLIQELRDALSAKMAFLALQQELDIARKLQLSMLPKHFPQRPDFSAYAAMEPAKEVGGDFYDVFELDDERFGFVVADVSGKGVPAALFMAMSRTLLKATAIFGIAPHRCMAKLNDMLEESNEQSMFVTVFYGILDTGRGVFTYSNGGHNPPYLLKADGSVSALPTTNGTALAVFPGLTYAENEIGLEPGDTIFMYTDGITEAFDPDEAMFGDPMLIDQLGRCRGMEPEQVVSTMMQAVHTFARGAPQSDDMTCLAFRLQPSAEMKD